MNGQGFLIWTTENGGLFKVEKCSQEDYEEIKLTRRVRVNHYWDGPPQYVEPFFIAFARVEDNFDFSLGGDRDKPETWSNASA